MGTCICVTCGNHFPDPCPEICTVCADERQWVPPGGQRWTTLAELAAAGHRSDIRPVEPGLTGIGADPTVAIGQRSGKDRVTFVWSAPNRLPLSAAAVRGVVSAVEPYRFDRIYGGWWAPVLRSGAWETVRRSALRYIEHLNGTARQGLFRQAPGMACPAGPGRVVPERDHIAPEGDEILQSTI